MIKPSSEWTLEPDWEKVNDERLRVLKELFGRKNEFTLEDLHSRYWWFGHSDVGFKKVLGWDLKRLADDGYEVIIKAKLKKARYHLFRRLLAQPLSGLICAIRKKVKWIG